jgi:hypothetical protein
MVALLDVISFESLLSERGQFPSLFYVKRIQILYLHTERFLNAKHL